MKQPKPLPHNLDAIKAAVANPERLEAVRATGYLDMTPNKLFEALTQEASRLLDAPVALLTLVDQHRDVVLGQTGLPEPMASSREITASPSFCQLTVTQGETVVIQDTHDQEFYRLFPSVEGSGVRAHLGVPLFLGGRVVGNCCVIDVRPRQWTGADIETMERLAKTVMAQLEANIKRRALA